MVFSIKEETSSGTLIFSTNGTLENGVPTIFFTKNSFEVEAKPMWVVNPAIQREGDFTHYAGSEDDEFSVELILYGTTRKTNLATVKEIKNKIFYLDASDIDSNLSNKYTCKRFRTIYDEVKEIIRINMTWKEYNND